MQLYKISFLNGCSSKSYIGISSKSAKQRFIEHCSSKKKYPIVQAIKKYGKENTLLTIIGEFKDWNSLYIAEQLAIIEHNYNVSVFFHPILISVRTMIQKFRFGSCILALVK